MTLIPGCIKIPQVVHTTQGMKNICYKNERDSKIDL